MSVVVAGASSLTPCVTTTSSSSRSASFASAIGALSQGGMVMGVIAPVPQGSRAFPTLVQCGLAHPPRAERSAPSRHPLRLAQGHRMNVSDVIHGRISSADLRRADDELFPASLQAKSEVAVEQPTSGETVLVIGNGRWAVEGVGSTHSSLLREVARRGLPQLAWLAQTSPKRGPAQSVLVQFHEFSLFLNIPDRLYQRTEDLPKMWRASGFRGTRQGLFFCPLPLTELQGALGTPPTSWRPHPRVHARHRGCVNASATRADRRAAWLRRSRPAIQRQRRLHRVPAATSGPIRHRCEYTAKQALTSPTVTERSRATTSSNSWPPPAWCVRLTLVTTAWRLGLAPLPASRCRFARSAGSRLFPGRTGRRACHPGWPRVRSAMGTWERGC